MSSVTVRIFGEEYNIRSKDDPAYVQKVAEYLDGKMREIASGGGAALPAGKVAILAALNIADEYFKLQDSSRTQAETVNRVASELVKVLDQALGSED